MITILETTLQLTNQKKDLGKKALFLTGLGLIGTSGAIFGYEHAKEKAEKDNLMKQYVNQALSQLEHHSKDLDKDDPRYKEFLDWTIKQYEK